MYVYQSFLFQLQQSASQRAYLQSRYPAEKLFCTIEDHNSADSLDLALSKGHLVAVLKKQDPMGSSLRWFVDNGGIFFTCKYFIAVFC